MRLLGRAAIPAALLLALVGCASQQTGAAPAPAPAAHRAPSGALVFSSPVTRAGSPLGLDGRRDALISARDQDPLRATQQWPEQARPEERQIRTIYSRWGRSF